MHERYASILCGALAVIKGPGRTITFVRQQYGPFGGNWLLPGGSMQIGEDPASAVVREIMEETGLEVSSPELFAIYEMTGQWEHGEYHILMFAFRTSTELMVSEHFVGHNVASVKQAQVGALPLHSTDLRILTDAGVASFTEERIQRALETDHIQMRAYRVIG